MRRIVAGGCGNDKPDDHIVAYENTLADGVGATVRDKFIVLKTGGASRPTIEKGSGDA